MKHLIIILFFSAPFLAQAQQLTIAGHSLPELRQAKAVQLPPLFSQSIRKTSTVYAGR